MHHLILDCLKNSRVLYLKLSSHGIKYYLCSADQSKSFSQLIVLIFIFSQYFFNRFCPVEKYEVTPSGLYRDPLTLKDKYLEI